MRIALVMLLLLGIAALPASAVVPGTMNYQGILTDGGGNVVSDGPYSVSFALYNTPTGGSALWSEAQTVITSSGLFNVILGSSTPIPGAALMDTAAYLEMTVETDPPMSPRTRLTSHAYSVVTSSLIGEGPVHIKQFDPSSGDSSVFDILVTPDSTYASKRQHKPFQILKSIDKASPLEAELSILSTSGSTDSVMYSRILSSTEGFLESNKSTTPTATASGKRQHRPVSFSKEWGAHSGTLGIESSTIFDLDSGYTRTIALDDGDVTVEMFQQANFPNAPVTKSRTFVFPHLLESGKSKKTSTGDEAMTRQFVDADSGVTRIAKLQRGDHRIVSAERLGAPPEGGTAIPDINRFRSSLDETSGDSSMCWCHFDADSGYITRIAVKQGSHHMESADMIGAPPMGAIAIPNLLEARKGANESAGDTASSWNFVDPDSGCGETATLISSDGTTTFSRVAKAPKGTGPGSPTTVFEIGVETNSSTAGGGHAQEVLDIVAGYHKSAGIDQTDLITSNETGTSQTREHILLSRQVGVSSSTPANRSLECQTDDDGVLARLQRGDPDDSSGVELFADDDSSSIVLYSSTSAHPRYSNITLKRGVVSGAEMSLGYDDAGSGAMIYAVSSPAAGAQLGIGTTTPTEALHIVGNGCYTGTFGACSDRRYKEHIETLAQPLDLVSRLRGVRFDWKRQDFPDQNFPEGEQVGLIAQEVESVVPSVVHTGTDGYKSVDYAKLVPLLIEGMKAQDKRIAELEARLEAMEGTRTLGQR